MTLHWTSPSFLLPCDEDEKSYVFCMISQINILRKHDFRGHEHHCNCHRYFSLSLSLINLGHYCSSAAITVHQEGIYRRSLVPETRTKVQLEQKRADNLPLHYPMRCYSCCCCFCNMRDSYWGKQTFLIRVTKIINLAQNFYCEWDNKSIDF